MTSRLVNFIFISSQKNLEPFSRLAIEQVNLVAERFEADLVARLERMTLAEHRDDLFAAGEPRIDLHFRAGRLDHHDLRGEAALTEREMLGPEAEGDRLAIARRRRRRQRQAHAALADKRGA